MDFSNQVARNFVMEWAKRISHQLATHDDKASAEAVDQAIKQFVEDRFTITIVGKAKRGKSTLINALLGRKDDTVAPVDKLPASSVITRFFPGSNEGAVVRLRDGREEPIEYAHIREYVTEEGNPEN